MVRRSLEPRPGVSLVETIVALTLLGVGLLGVLTTEILAARLLREAEAHAGAVAVAGAVLDSLLTTPAPGAGERDAGRYRATWEVVPEGGLTRIELRVEYHDGTGPRVLHFESLHAPPLLRFGGIR